MKENRFYKAAEKGYSFRAFGYDINLAFLWFDLWFGFYYDRAKRALYFCPLPAICFRIRRAAKIRVSIKIIGAEMAKTKIGEYLARFDKLKQEELERIADLTKKRIMNISDNYAERMNYQVFSPHEKQTPPPVVAFSPNWKSGNVSADDAKRSTRLAIESQPNEITLDPENDPKTLTYKKLMAMVERARFRPPVDTRRGELKPSIPARGFRKPPKNRRKRREGKGKAK